MKEEGKERKGKKGRGKKGRGKKGRGRKGKDTVLLKLKEEKNTAFRSSLYDRKESDMTELLN